jgi:hypothetical protein
MFRDKVAVYCANHAKYTSTLCGQNAEFYYGEASGRYTVVITEPERINSINQIFILKAFLSFFSCTIFKLFFKY